MSRLISPTDSDGRHRILTLAALFNSEFSINWLQELSGETPQLILEALDLGLKNSWLLSERSPANCSVTKRGLSPAPSNGRWVALNWPMGGRCFWTRLAISRRRPRFDCCACSKAKSLNGWGDIKPCTRISGFWPRPIRTLKKRCRQDDSDRISISG